MGNGPPPWFWLANETWTSVPHHLEPRRHAFPAGQHIDVLFSASLKVGRGHSTSHSRRVVILAASYRVGELDDPVGQWGRWLHPDKRAWHNGWDMFTMYEVGWWHHTLAQYSTWLHVLLGWLDRRSMAALSCLLVATPCCLVLHTNHKYCNKASFVAVFRGPWPVPAMISELHNFPSMFRARVDLIAHVRSLVAPPL